MNNLLTDSLGRRINSLRVSVTDRCNFRCRYCMPAEGMKWLDRSELLTFEEIERIVRIAVGLGITKIRLTGGEPLLRKDLPVLVNRISSIGGLSDIALTTNGYLLAEHAGTLKDAGLQRINVSLDSIDKLNFQEMARGDYFEKVWHGLETARRFGFALIKINVVILRGINDGEIEKFARLARESTYTIRFIEYMPLGAGEEWDRSDVFTTKEVIERINGSFPHLRPIEYHGAQPADRYRFADGKGEIGFISSVSDPFCEHCNRIRITSEGKLRTCLFSLTETDLRSLLRGGTGDDEIRALIAGEVMHKEPGHRVNEPDFVKPERTMSQIGG